MCLLIKSGIQEIADKMMKVTINTKKPNPSPNVFFLNATCTTLLWRHSLLICSTSKSRTKHSFFLDGIWTFYNVDQLIYFDALWCTYIPVNLSYTLNLFFSMKDKKTYKLCIGQTYMSQYCYYKNVILKSKDVTIMLYSHYLW